MFLHSPSRKILLSRSANHWQNIPLAETMDGSTIDPRWIHWFLIQRWNRTSNSSKHLKTIQVSHVLATPIQYQPNINPAQSHFQRSQPANPTTPPGAFGQSCPSRRGSTSPGSRLRPTWKPGLKFCGQHGQTMEEVWWKVSYILGIKIYDAIRCYNLTRRYDAWLAYITCQNHGMIHVVFHTYKWGLLHQWFIMKMRVSLQLSPIECHTLLMEL